MQSPTTPAVTLRQWLEAGPFGLALSSGFFGFFAHCGMLSVLEEARLLPQRMSGSSAGALVAGFWAAGLDTVAMRDILFGLSKNDFWDPWPGPGLLRGKRFHALLEHWLPVRYFEQCRVPLAVSTYDLAHHRTRVIDSGALAPAIRASCSVPLMFHPVWHGWCPLMDGGVRDRPGLAGMPAGRVLYHHLASRSPWRRRNGAHTHIPHRPDLQALVIHALDRVGPNRMQQGSGAYRQAREATLIALDLPIDGSPLNVSAGQ